MIWVFETFSFACHFCFLSTRSRKILGPRFWGKSKYGDKKTSREKLICGAEALDGDTGDTGPLLGEGVISKSKMYPFQIYCYYYFCLLRTESC